MKTRFLLILCLILALSWPAYAEFKTSVDITEVGMGARPIALGGAYTGLADDASAIFTNPAGLGLQNKLSFVSMSTQILTCVDYKVAGFSYPTQYGNFGIGYIGASSPAGDYTYIKSGVTVEGGPMYYSNQMLILSYGNDISDLLSNTIYSEGGKIKSVCAGINIKMLSQGFSGGMKDAPSASGSQVDIGTMYMPNDRLTVGAVLQNIYRGGRGSNGSSIAWTTGENENLPELLKIGFAYKVLDSVTLNLDSTSSLNSSRDLLLGGGVEWKVVPYVALRAGLDQKNEAIDDAKVGVVTKTCLGVGLNYAGFGFDYAYRQDPVFTEFSTQYFSISYSGGPITLPAKSKSDTIAQQDEPENIEPVQKDEKDIIPSDDERQSETNPLTQYERIINQSNIQSNNQSGTVQ